MARAYNGSSTIGITDPTGIAPSAAFSFGCWVYRDDHLDTRGCMALGPGGFVDSTRGFSTISRTSANLEFRWGGGVGIGGGTLTDATWYRVGASYNPVGTTVLLGLDGTQIARSTTDAIGALSAGDKLTFGDPGSSLSAGSLKGRLAGAFYLQGVTLSLASIDTYLNNLCSLITDYGPSGGVTANALKGLWLFQSANPGEDISGVGNHLTNSGTTDVADPSGVPASCSAYTPPVLPFLDILLEP